MEFKSISLNKVKNMDDLFGVIGTFVNFVLVLILISVQMDYMAIAVGGITLVGTILTGVWWIVKHLIDKGMNIQHQKEFEQQTAKSFLAFSSDIKEIKDSIDKISKEQAEQKASIARLEGKMDTFQHRKK